MKKIIIHLIILLLFSCKNKTETNNKNLLSKKEYYLVHQYFLPFEIKVNNVIVDKESNSGKNGAINLNNFILNKGKQKIEVKVFHPYIEKGGKITSENLSKMGTTLIESHNDSNDILSKKVLNFPEIKEPVPFIEYEWEFDTELPFELEGWKNSEDLSKWDEKELEKKVLNKFNELRNILNSGKGSAFVKELEFANEELFIANYFSEAQKQEYVANLVETYSEHEGIMPEINNYRMRIMGDGKVVSLENIGNHKGQGVLTAEFLEEKTLFQNYVMLHIPNGKKDLEIVRINSQMTSID